MLYFNLIARKKRGVLYMDKIGTITVSVFKKDTTTHFDIETDNDNVINVSYLIEDALKLY